MPPGHAFEEKVKALYDVFRSHAFTEAELRENETKRQRALLAALPGEALGCGHRKLSRCDPSGMIPGCLRPGFSFPGFTCGDCAQGRLTCTAAKLCDECVVNRRNGKRSRKVAFTAGDATSAGDGGGDRDAVDGDSDRDAEDGDGYRAAPGKRPREGVAAPAALLCTDSSSATNAASTVVTRAASSIPIFSAGGMSGALCVNEESTARAKPGNVDEGVVADDADDEVSGVVQNLSQPQNV